MRRSRPMVHATPDEDNTSSERERIAKVVFPSGKTVLVSCRIRDDGAEEVVLYEASRGVRTYCETRIRTLSARRNREKEAMK